MTESVLMPAHEAIHAYVAHVRAHLSDLPADDLDDLVGGLEADLAERAAESPPGTDLTVAFGEPGEYAAELRAAAGYPPRLAGPAPAGPSGFQVMEQGWRARTDRLFGRYPWLRELRPVWWLARGALLVAVPMLILGAGLFNPLMWLLVLGAAAVSFWWSRRSLAPSTAMNRLAILANVGAVILLLPLLTLLPARIYHGGAPVQYVEVAPSGFGGSGAWVNGEPASNLYVYDAEGNRIDRVRIFNQYGQAVAVPADAFFQGDLPRDFPRDAFESADLEAVNLTVFPVRWGTRTGWEASLGDWEPPVRISTLPAEPGQASMRPTPSPAPDPNTSPSTGASVEPTASPEATQ